MLYRIYTLTDRDRGELSAQLEFADDAAAMAFARSAMNNGYAVEVWREDFLVERVGGRFDLDLAALDSPKGGRSAARRPSATIL